MDLRFESRKTTQILNWSGCAAWPFVVGQAVAELCEKHNLVLAHDGMCVLCRRSRPHLRAHDPNPGTVTDAIVTGLLGLGLIGALGMLLWASQLPPPDDGPRYALNAETRRLSSTDAQAIEASADTTPIASPASATAGLERTPTADPTTLAAARADALSQAREHERQKRKLYAQRAEVEAAKRTVSITMYSTSWCTICETSRFYMMGRELKYTEHDIERDAKAARRLARLNRARSVPTFVVDGDEVLVGFNAWQLEGALEDAARKRVQKRACSTDKPACEGEKARK